MFNAWDFLFAVLLVLSAWLGWKLKSLPLLGAAFAFALAPLAAAQWDQPLGTALVENLNGAGLQPNQDKIAWWLITITTAILLMLLFRGFSKMLAALKLEFLDRGFGALICAAIFLACLSLNIGRLAKACEAPKRKSLQKSWSWSHARIGKEPAWLENVQEKIESITKSTPPPKRGKSSI